MHHYLQDPLSAAFLAQAQAWVAHVDTHGLNGDCLWTVVDGAIVGAECVRSLCNAYGEPVHVFERSALDEYGDFGLLLWPLARMAERDRLIVLREAVDRKPCLSVVRSGTTAKLLQEVLTWLAAADTSDRMRLYLRVGDTRVLPNVLNHLSPVQTANLQAVVREWVWPDRAGNACTWHGDAPPPVVPLAGSMVLEDRQYAALFDDAEADILYAEISSLQSGWHDEMPCMKRHAWLVEVLQRMMVLGIEDPNDRMAFVGFALRMPGTFERLPELGETWRQMRSGAAGLPETIGAWGPAEMQALERFWLQETRST